MGTTAGDPMPTAEQVRVVRAAVAWYLKTHHAGGGAPGTAAMFCDAMQVGAFAVEPCAITAGDGPSLFRMLVASAMFQRRQDQQILRILRGMSLSVIADITSPSRLLLLARECSCPHIKSVDRLRERCDLSKNPSTGMGTCGARPAEPCPLKAHTVALKRYGHFGKMPTSLALALRESGDGGLPGLFERIVRAHRTRIARAVALEASLSAAWRVSQKIASMFLSAVTNPDLSPGCTVPWARRIDWTYFVVVDSNVDLFLASIGYAGRGTYDARRDFIRAIAERIDLRTFDGHLRPNNPRIVQQAMYLFMSVTNRRVLAGDCSLLGARACRRCPERLATRCALHTRTDSPRGVPAVGSRQIRLPPPRRRADFLNGSAGSRTEGFGTGGRSRAVKSANDKETEHGHCNTTEHVTH